MPGPSSEAEGIQRGRVLYISYDGMGEPLGRSQVLSYLSRLSTAYAVTLVSFEKVPPTPDLREDISSMGLNWVPLRYHRRPPVLSTAWDVWRGRRCISRCAQSEPPDVVHVRSYVAALMAVLAGRGSDSKLLFDIRGLWADERVDGGIWRQQGFLHRLSKRYERRFFREADAVVTLTEASIPVLERLLEGRRVPIEVIPTCVELTRFAGRPPRPGGPHLVWSGSIGTWYRFDLAARLVEASGLPLTVMTRQPELARRALAGIPATVVSVDPQAVPGQLFRGDIGLSLIAEKPSKVASAPTRVGEYLAAGMPVVVTPVGDLGRLVEDHQVGVVLEADRESAIRHAAHKLQDLLGDADLPDRCQQLARERFDADTGAALYGRLYERLRTTSEPASLPARVAKQPR